MRILIGPVFLLLTLPISAQPSADRPEYAEWLLGQGLHREEVQGDCPAAIESYRKILDLVDVPRPLTARALFQMGGCYEHRQPSKAREAYKALLEGYADQAVYAEPARRRLASLEANKTTPMPKMELTVLDEDTITADRIFGPPSPDGKYIPFVHFPRSAIFLYDLESAKTVPFLDDSADGDQATETFTIRRMAWSPDGRILAFNHLTAEGLWELQAADWSGSRRRTVCSLPGFDVLDVAGWSPDGSAILVRFSPAGIAWVAVADGSTRIVVPSNAAPIGNICLSADGRFIAFDRFNRLTDRWNIEVLSTAGRTDPVPISAQPSDQRVLGWSPDGRYLVFSGEMEEGVGIYLLPMREGRTAGSAQLYGQERQRLQPLGWTRQGRFYYLHAEYRVNVYTSQLDTSGRPLLSSPMLIDLPARRTVPELQARKNKASGFTLSMLRWQKESPLQVVAIDSDTNYLFNKYRLFHCGSQPIEAFQIGWKLIGYTSSGHRIALQSGVEDLNHAELLPGRFGNFTNRQCHVSEIQAAIIQNPGYARYVVKIGIAYVLAQDGSVYRYAMNDQRDFPEQPSAQIDELYRQRVKAGSNSR